MTGKKGISARQSFIEDDGFRLCHRDAIHYEMLIVDDDSARVPGPTMRSSRIISQLSSIRTLYLYIYINLYKSESFALALCSEAIHKPFSLFTPRSSMPTFPREWNEKRKRVVAFTQSTRVPRYFCLFSPPYGNVQKS